MIWVKCEGKEKDWKRVLTPDFSRPHAHMRGGGWIRGPNQPARIQSRNAEVLSASAVVPIILGVLLQMTAF